jgi:hypothetical protein
MVSFPLQDSVSLYILRVRRSISAPVIPVTLAPPLLRIILVATVVRIGKKLSLSPLIPSRLLATDLRTVSLMSYISPGDKRFSAVLASPFHFSLPKSTIPMGKNNPKGLQG